MTKILCTTITSAESNACNSLEGVEGYANLDTALVQETNRWYRFFAASTVAPNGVTVIAPANITPPDPGRWIRQGVPALGGNRSQFPVETNRCDGSDGDNPFDYVLRSRADVLALPGVGAGPEYLMPTGSYAVADAFAMDAGESWSFQAGARIWGMTRDTLVQFDVDGGPAITIDSVVSAYGFAAENLGNGNGVLLAEDSRFETLNCFFAAVLAGVIVNETDSLIPSFWKDVGSEIVGPTDAVEALGAANISLSSTRLTSSNNRGLFATGLGVADIMMVGCSSSSLSHCIEVDKAVTDGTLRVSSCDLLTTGEAATGIRLDGLTRAIVTGGTIRNSFGVPTGAAIRVGGDIDSLTASGVHLDNWAVGVLRFTGASRAVALSGVTSNDLSSSGVSWAAANIPSDALLLSGCAWDAPAAYANFAVTDARVNAKCQADNAGLALETAIVV